MCEVGSDQWQEFSTLPNSAFTPMGLDYLDKTLPVIRKKAADEINTEMAEAIGKNPYVGAGCGVLLVVIAYILLTMFDII